MILSPSGLYDTGPIAFAVDFPGQTWFSSSGCVRLCSGKEKNRRKRHPMGHPTLPGGHHSLIRAILRPLILASRRSRSLAIHITALRMTPQAPPIRAAPITPALRIPAADIPAAADTDTASRAGSRRKPIHRASIACQKCPIVTD